MNDSENIPMPEGASPGSTEDSVAIESATTSGKPWWRRTSIWIAGAAVIAVGVTGAWLLSGSDASTTTDTVAALKYAEVARTTLEDVTTLDGTLGFVAGDPLVYAGSPDGIVTIAAGAPGTVTSIAGEGETVEEGEILYTRDEQPVIVFYGDIPAYRTLNSRATDGADVLQLEEALTRLGYDEDGDFDLDGDYTYAT